MTTTKKPILVHMSTADLAALDRVARDIQQRERLAQPNRSATIRKLIHEYDQSLTVIRANEEQRK